MSLEEIEVHVHDMFTILKSIQSRYIGGEAMWPTYGSLAVTFRNPYQLGVGSKFSAVEPGFPFHICGSSKLKSLRIGVEFDSDQEKVTM